MWTPHPSADVTDRPRRKVRPIQLRRTGDGRTFVLVREPCSRGTRPDGRALWRAFPVDYPEPWRAEVAGDADAA